MTIPPISLQVGAMSETVSVTADGRRPDGKRGTVGPYHEPADAGIAAERALLIGTAKLLPGIIDTANRESPGWNDLVGININGTRAGIDRSQRWTALPASIQAR